MRGERLVLITCPPAAAEALARRLVDARIAACVQRVPVQSVYRWEGVVEDEPEVLLLAKTTEERWEELQRVLAAEHPYEVPECIAVEPARVADAYLAWWRAETGRGSR